MSNMLFAPYRRQIIAKTSMLIRYGSTNVVDVQTVEMKGVKQTLVKYTNLREVYLDNG